MRKSGFEYAKSITFVKFYVKSINWYFLSKNDGKLYSIRYV